MAGLIDQSDLLIASEIAQLAIQLGPEVYDAITGAIKAARPELVPGDLPVAADLTLADEAKAMIAAKFEAHGATPAP